MKLVINKDRSVIPVGTWGTVNENDYEILEFEFPAELDGYNKRIVYYLGDERVWDTIVNNKAYITNAITTKGDVKAYVWCTKENTEREADTDFRTMLFVMNFFENDNADGIVPTEQQVDGFNTMLTAMNAKIDEVDALEQTIGAAEAQRQEAEATRVSNESTRQLNESTRQTNEQTRQSQEADRERRTNEAIGNIEDKTVEYNQNAEAKTNEFNQNASQKTNDFNSNYTQKVNDFNTNANTQKTDFNSNASSKTSAFNSNAETKTNAFNTNATNKTNAFNSNATEKTTAFDNNASTKTSEFNTNAESKMSAFNDNATQKTTNFDNNASEKTDEFNTNAQNKIDEYDEHIVEYQAQIDELQEEVEELSENMPWNTTEQATEIQVTDAAKYSKNKLELFGNTEQPFVLPPNYTPLDYIESTGTQYIDTGVATSNTIKVEAEVINTFGFIRNNRTYGGALFGGRKSSTNSNFSYVTGDIHDYVGKGNNFIEIDKNVNTDLLKIQYDTSSVNIECGNYKYINNNLSINITNSFNIYIFANNQDNTIASYGTFKLYKFKIYDNDTLVRDFVPCKSENNEGGLFDLVSNTFFTNQGTGTFTLGNEIKSIHVVTGNNTIGVTGKNIFSGDTLIQVGETGTKRNGFYVTTPGTYTVSYSNNNSSRYFSFRVIDNGVYGTYSSINSPYTFTISQNQTAIVYIGDENKTFSQQGFYNVQIELGSTATSYVPYYHADHPINLGSLELCKIEDYQDYLYKKNGNWYKYEAINKVVLDGHRNYVKSSRYSSEDYPVFFLQAGIPNFDNNCNIYCNKFIQGNYIVLTDKECMKNLSQLHVRISASRLNGDTPADYKTWLASNNLTVYYGLNNATSTQITDETLISQLEAIYNHLALVKGTNHITITPSDLEPYVTLNYMQDLPSKLDNLDSRLALLE